jgi:hypothetical protein
MNYIRQVETGPFKGVWFGVPMGESIIHGDGTHLSCDYYPDIGERNCRINGKLVSPLVYRRAKKSQNPRDQWLAFRWRMISRGHYESSLMNFRRTPKKRGKPR